MNVLLVNPPLTAEEQSGGGGLAKVSNIIPPLGVAYIAAVLEKADFEVKITDCPPLDITQNTLKKMVDKEQPDILGITATTLSFDSSIKVAENARQVSPDSHIFIGGPHATAAPLETIETGVFDAGVVGEGEYTFLELAEKIRDKELDLKSVKGIVFQHEKKMVFTERRPFIKNLDELPFPALHLLPPLTKYKPTPANYKKTPGGSMITSRGCPNQCIFCDRAIFGNTWRAHSPERVVDEIEFLINEHGAREIRVWDDTFTISQKRVFKICDEIKNRDIDISWTCLTRVNNVSFELLKSMKEAGCWQVSYGLEAGTQEILDTMKKGITLEESKNAVKWSKKAGLNVRAFFVMGVPGHTDESLKETIDFAKGLDVDMANFYAITPYPGTELFRMAQQEGTLLHQDYKKYHEMISMEHSKLPYVPEDLTEDRLKEIVVNAHKEFYLRPGYILKQIAQIRGIGDIKRAFRGFMAIITS